MKKIFAILLTLVMVISMFTGCDGSHDYDHAPTTEPTEVITDPTIDETEAPTEAPTEEPEVEETKAPTETPTEAPTEASTETPTEAPAEEPEAEETGTVHQHSYERKVTAEPTCSNDGVATYTCSCGASYTESIAAGHDYECTDTRPATCSNTGDKTYTCKTCGHSYKETLPKNEHKWSEWTVTLEPTTASYGKKVRTCELCYGAQEANIDPLPAETEPVHQHSYSSEVTTAATCTTDGVKTYTCSCGASYTEAIAKTGHSWELYYSTATCTNGGTAHYTCACGATYEKEVPKNEHVWGEWVVTKEPTTTECGYKMRTCQLCYGGQQATIDPLPADDGGDNGDGEGGYYWFGNQKIYWDCASQGHKTMGEPEVIQRATCVHDKIVKYTCVVVGCGATWEENRGGAGSVSHVMSAADQARVTCGDYFYHIKCNCGLGINGSTRDEALAKHNAHVAENLYDGYCGIMREWDGHHHNFPGSTFNCAVCNEAIPFDESYVVCAYD